MKNRNDLKENLDLAYKFFKNKNFEKAENLYKKILKKFPKSFDANYSMASIKAYISDIINCLSLLSRVITKSI